MAITSQAGDRTHGLQGFRRRSWAIHRSGQVGQHSSVCGRHAGSRQGHGSCGKHQEQQEWLTSIFDVRDLGEAKYFLGMSLDTNRQKLTLKMFQPRLASELVHEFGEQDQECAYAPHQAHPSSDGQGAKQGFSFVLTFSQM